MHLNWPSFIKVEPSTAVNTGVVAQQDARGIHEDVTDPSVTMIGSGLMWQLKMLVNNMLSPSIIIY